MKNVIKQDKEGTYIEITSKTYGIKKCYIDEEDVEKVQEHKWYVIKRKEVKSSDVYYVRSNFKVHGKWTALFIHRLLLKPEKGLYVDHIDGNPLNNRRSNLRIVTHQQNHFNRKRARGYHWDRKKQRYKAEIRINGKLIHLGSFNIEEEARAAYLAAKEKYHKI